MVILGSPRISTLFQFPGEPRPLSTHLGHVAVDEAVLVVYDQVLEVVGRQHLSLAAVTQTRLLQQLPAAVEGPLGGRQLRLPVGGATEEEEPKKEKKKNRETVVVGDQRDCNDSKLCWWSSKKNYLE